MPKSRRDKRVTLAKTQKKIGLESKQALVDRIRGAVDDHARCFVFVVENMRNQPLKDLREQWNHSKFFLGKNRVMSLALGKSQEEEYNSELHKVSAILRHQCGLLFTNQTKDQVLSFFDSHEVSDFARTGGIATDEVTLSEGPLTQFAHSVEPQLRALGLPTALKKGVVTLLQDQIVCREGDTLTSEQARILKLLGHHQATFKLNMVAMWSNDGTFEILKEGALEATDADDKDESDKEESDEMSS